MNGEQGAWVLNARRIVNDVRERARRTEKRNAGRYTSSTMVPPADLLQLCDLAERGMVAEPSSNPFGDAYVGTCDFGDCNRDTVAVVWDEARSEYLSMCKLHAVMTLYTVTP